MSSHLSASPFVATASPWRRPVRGVRRTIVLSFAAVAAAVFALTLGTVVLQWRAAENAALLEAQNLARAVAYGSVRSAEPLQLYAEGLDELYRRGIVFVDARQVATADARLGELGRVYGRDARDEVGATLADGRTRVFEEFAAADRASRRQVVVPVRQGHGEAGAIVGAVVLEYTDIRSQLLHDALLPMAAIAAAGLACVLAIGLLGLRLAREMAARLGRLQQGVQAVADGQFDARLPITRDDEIGWLTAAFNKMTRALARARSDLVRAAQQEAESARRIEKLAYFDTLTGLPNRWNFSRQLQEQMERSRREDRRLALFFIDIDRFKAINDTLGHAAGDELLQEVGRRLGAAVRQADLVARLGGDEFVVVLPQDNTPEELLAVGQRLLHAVGRPMTLAGQQLRVTASIGATVFPLDGDDERTLMKNADIALYRSKEDGRNCLTFYGAAMDGDGIERLAFESSLRSAIEAQQFEVYYQPKVDGRSGEVLGYEALLRWLHPTLGTVPPSRFIPVAEETGLIVELGKWALRSACRQQVAWREALGPGGHARAPHVAVNLSVRQFADEHLVEDVRRILAETGMHPQALELEITESLLMRDMARAEEVLQALKALGLRLSVDDFGTGYSSLANLKRFPIDTLKVDRSFIRDLHCNADDRAISNAIITMGHTLGMSIVAEGVELQAQADILREQGCDQFQGYLYGRPLPAAQARLPAPAC